MTAHEDVCALVVDGVTLVRHRLSGVGRLKARLEDLFDECAMDLAATAIAISRIRYGRPRRLTAEGVLEEQVGTCSTKHLLFAAVVSETWPELRPGLWHRPHVVTRELASARWGKRVAEAVPISGLTDVHTFATLDLGDGLVQVDVTFPLTNWDGLSDIALACGDGDDYPAGDDPLASKAQLVSRCCDPVVREPFIAALSTVNH